jgi:hypothetical protein
MRRLIISLTVLTMLFVVAGTAMAAVNNKAGLPTATFSGATVSVTGGDFSGLGNTPAIATLTVSGEATYDCANPQGHLSPGQNPVDAVGGSSGPTELRTTKNGRATIGSLSASISFPATPDAQTVGCGGQGSEQWTVVPKALTALAAHLVITHGAGGPVIFCRDYTLGGPNTGTAC